MKVLYLIASVLAGGIGGVDAAPINPTFNTTYAEFFYTYENETLTGSMYTLNYDEDGTVTGGGVRIESLYLASGRGIATVTGDALTRPQVYDLYGPTDPIDSYLYDRDFVGAEPDSRVNEFPLYNSYQGGEPIYVYWDDLKLTARPLEGFDYEIWDAGFTFSGYPIDWGYYPDGSDPDYAGTLAPVPLPASGLFLFAAIGAAAAIRRKL